MAMHINTRDGLISGATIRISPNADDRPADGTIDLLVIHNISLPPGEFGGPWIDDLFLNRLDPEAHPYFKEICHLHVSAHALIRRDGSITQYVPFHRRAWHAGESQYRGRTRCNDFSIGIEMEGSDDSGFTDAQYDSLISLSAALISSYPGLSQQRVAGHSDIAPGRKTDPGPRFNWRQFKMRLSRQLEQRGAES